MRCVRFFLETFWCGELDALTHRHNGWVRIERMCEWSEWGKLYVRMGAFETTEGLNVTGQTESKLRVAPDGIAAVSIWSFLLFEPNEWETERERKHHPWICFLRI